MSRIIVRRILSLVIAVGVFVFWWVLTESRPPLVYIGLGVLAIAIWSELRGLVLEIRDPYSIEVGGEELILKYFAGQPIRRIPKASVVAVRCFTHSFRYRDYRVFFSIYLETEETIYVSARATATTADARRLWELAGEPADLVFSKPDGPEADEHRYRV